jgi:hypothetical protein
MPDKEERIKILVSSKSESRRFTLNPGPLYASSAYLARKGARSSQPGSQIRLNVTDMDLFRMFLTWIKASRSKEDMDSLEEDIREEPWLSKTAHAWIFSTLLEAPEFASFCLVAFMRNCALAPTGPWALIETKALPGSPLRRFANHWVAWNASFLTGTTHEYVGLKAASYTKMVDAYTGDPREYDELHWYTLGCGDSLSPRCSHNPAARKEMERLANRPPAPPIDTEYGKDFELARKKK